MRSFPTLLADLTTIGANRIQPAAGQPGVHLDHHAHPVQRQAFELLGASHRLGYAESAGIRRISADRRRGGHRRPYRALAVGLPATQLLGGNIRFVLSTSGHVASMVNPPSNPTATFRLAPGNPPDHREWLAQAETMQGS